jgi:VanZ family protein
MRRVLVNFPVLLWMALIFFASTDIGSTEHTSRIIGPLLRWFKPDISAQTIHDVQVVIRKTGHVSEYAVLAILMWTTRRSLGKTPAWSRREVILIVGLCALYAASDEFHQTFVPSRGPSVWDVLIDSAGASVGLLILWCLGRLWCRFRDKRVGVPASAA